MELSIGTENKINYALFHDLNQKFPAQAHEVSFYYEQELDKYEITIYSCFKYRDRNKDKVKDYTKRICKYVLDNFGAELSVMQKDSGGYCYHTFVPVEHEALLSFESSLNTN